MRRSVPSALGALRPRQWAHFVVLPIASLSPELPWGRSLPALGRGVVVAACVLGYGYLLNAISDRGLDSDATKNPLRHVATIPPRLQWALLVLPLVALALSATAPWPVPVATSTALLSGTVYSVGPRLKAIPGVGTLLNVGCFVPLLFVGLAEPALGGRLGGLAACFAALLVQNQLLHEAADAPEDRRGGVRTTFVALGPVPLAWCSAACGALALLSLGGLAACAGASPLLAALALPSVVVFPLQMARRGDRPARMRAARRLHRVYAALTGALAYAVTLGC